MNAHPIRSRLGRVVAVVVAGSVVGIAGALVVAADERPSRPADHYQADRDAIAEWAKANDASGLSPASLSSANRSFQFEAGLAAEYKAIADYARSAGLSGLSPASMSPVDD